MENQKKRFNYFYILQMSIIVIALCYILLSKPDSYHATSAVRVKIDSIAIRHKYSVLPDKHWVYYTKYGASLITNEQKYKVGDSITLKIVHFNEK